jgi:hypothetical protein
MGKCKKQPAQPAQPAQDAQFCVSMAINQRTDVLSFMIVFTENGISEHLYISNQTDVEVGFGLILKTIANYALVKGRNVKEDIASILPMWNTFANMDMSRPRHPDDGNSVYYI